jgi:hypothetical protein
MIVAAFLLPGKTGGIIEASITGSPSMPWTDEIQLRLVLHDRDRCRSHRAQSIASRSAVEDEMPNAALLFAVTVGLAVLPLAADAFSPGKAPMPAASNPSIIQIAHGCGPGWRWVPGHRNHYRRWVPGHCVRIY